MGEPENGKICYICGATKIAAANVHGEVIVDDEKEVILSGKLFNKNNEAVALCKECLASLLFTMADLFHEQSKSKDDPVSFH